MTFLSDLFDLDRRVMALAVARMADALGNSFLIIVLPLYVASRATESEVLGLGLSETFVAGFILALFGLVSSAAQPFAGRLSDRVGRRKIFVLVGLLAFGVTNFAFSFADSYLAMIAVRTGQGLAAALTITASVALVSELSTTGSRGGNMGVYNSFRLLGFGAGPLGAGFLVEGGPYDLGLLGAVSGYEAAFYVAAGAAFVSAALVVLLVEDPPDIEPTERKLAIRFLADAPARALDPIFTLGLATFFMSGCFSLLSTIEPQVNARLGQGPVLFAFEFAALIGALAVVQPLVGKASDRYGRKAFIMWGLVGLAPATLAQGLVTTPAAMIAARCVQGLAGACIFAPALALAGDLAEEGQAGAQLSVLTVSFGLGIAFGQLSSGSLIYFGFAVPFAFGGALALLGALLVLTQVREPRPVHAVGAG